MIVLTTRYPGKIDSATAGFPGGRIKNETTPGSTNDGTPLDAAWGNNIEGAFQAILAEAGMTPDNNIEQVGASQVLAALKAIIALGTVPTGAIMPHSLPTAPSGWIKGNGGTIGNASSGASTRANADTLNLYTAYWTNYDNARLPIFTSAGAASTRGANAAADFAANKRLAIPEIRGEHIRFWDDSRGIDAGRTMLSWQADDIKAHAHFYQYNTLNNSTGGGSNYRPESNVDGGVTSATGIAENRVRTIALLGIIKL